MSDSTALYHNALYRNALYRNALYRNALYHNALYHNAIAVATGWIASDDDERERQRRFLDLLAAQPGSVRADHPGAHITASAVVVSADFERILLCLHGRIGTWVQLGGHCEPVDETVADAAAREAWEESGIDGLMVNPTPIDLDIHPVQCRSGASFHYDIRFAFLAPPNATAVISAESQQLAWFLPDALPTPLANATQRLARPAIQAARNVLASPRVAKDRVAKDRDAR